MVWMTGESVGAECDDYIRIYLPDQLRREPHEFLAVNLGQAAVRIVETSGLGKPELLSGRIEFLLPNCSQG
jgi:hypothetical protein